MTDISDDARAYYADGFRRTIGGVPCKVFSRRTTDGRYIRAKGSPFYDAAFDHPKTGISRSTPASAERVEEIERKEAMEAVAALARFTAEPRDNVVHVDFAAAGAAPVLVPAPNLEACAAVAAFARNVAAMPEISPVAHQEEEETMLDLPQPETSLAGSAAPFAGALAVQADMRARLAALQARIAPAAEVISSEVEFAPGAAENCHSGVISLPAPESLNSPLPSDPRARAIRYAVAPASRRSPARERLLRRYLAMRKQRVLDRLALHMAGDAVREAQLEARRLQLEMERRRGGDFATFDHHQHGYEGPHRSDPDRKKPDMPHNPELGLVAMLHREREAMADRIATAEQRTMAVEHANAVLIREVHALSSRAHKAEAALRLQAAAELPRIAHVGSPSARVSFQLPARVQ